jgi:LmbE family N-acetylglucosaminyl deacetylase
MAMLLSHSAELVGYRHVYLAPHFDDAALSCGAGIARQTQAGEPVLVVTICSAVPPASAVFSEFAGRMHARWGLSAADVVQRRRQEELAALEILGADAFWLDRLDAIYRLPAAYSDDPTLFGNVAPADPLRAELAADLRMLQQHCPEAQFYVPLGVGRHVDHQITCRAALDGLDLPLSFYEDYPYAQFDGAVEQRLAELAPLVALQSRLVAAGAGLDRKIRAVAAYASQLDLLFGGSAAMADQVTQYASRIGTAESGPVERFWEAGERGSGRG